jgi:hypothetical protein
VSATISTVWLQSANASSLSPLHYVAGTGGCHRRPSWDGRRRRTLPVLPIAAMAALGVVTARARSRAAPTVWAGQAGLTAGLGRGATAH